MRLSFKVSVKNGKGLAVNAVNLKGHPVNFFERRRGHHVFDASCRSDPPVFKGADKVGVKRGEVDLV